MQKNETSSRSKKNEKNEEKQTLHIQAFLTEYEKIQDQMLHFIGGMNQNFLLSLGSASVVIPILVNSVNVDQNLIVCGLYFLAIIYGVIGLQYATSAFFVSSLANYVHKYLAPKLNQRVEANNNFRVMQWEDFIRAQNRNLMSLFMAVIGPSAASVLVVTPSFISILAAYYVQSLPSQLLQGRVYEFAASLLYPLSIVAWFVSILAAVAQVMNVVYALMSGYVAFKHK